MYKHAAVLTLALGHFCSPDNINSAYHITIKARGELRGRLNTAQFRSSLQIDHKAVCQLKLQREITGPVWRRSFIKPVFTVVCVWN